ncbi:hypothetical protein [Methanococcus voltae]|uniref:Uncharacterized protein n=1 Tax=Methanococcus voltae (strain ATCC BAA-1334 / A3) TaxID=456320 RepID=D7DSK0_METV3|nr:hypothetical protein [Methanococcus voltae]MCS3901709.1 uncharacterized protein YkvS [Methanococcus voltae]
MIKIPNGHHVIYNYEFEDGITADISVLVENNQVVDMDILKIVNYGDYKPDMPNLATMEYGTYAFCDFENYRG